MKIADLDQQVTIEEAWLYTDGGGGFTTDWQAIATNPVVFAAIRQTGLSQSLQADKNEFNAAYAITLRYRADMRPDYRLRTESAIYTITAIDDGDPAKTWLTLRATRLLL